MSPCDWIELLPGPLVSSRMQRHAAVAPHLDLLNHGSEVG